jgi:ABC-type Fe3+-hydroxamate transport system substrate-binding protein
MTDAILIKLAQYQTETRNQKKELKTYSQKLLDREEEMKEIKKEYEEKIKLLKDEMAFKDKMIKSLNTKPKKRKVKKNED